MTDFRSTQYLEDHIAGKATVSPEQCNSNYSKYRVPIVGGRFSFGSKVVTDSLT